MCSNGYDWDLVQLPDLSDGLNESHVDDWDLIVPRRGGSSSDTGVRSGLPPYGGLSSSGVCAILQRASSMRNAQPHVTTSETMKTATEKNISNVSVGSATVPIRPRKRSKSFTVNDKTQEQAKKLREEVWELKVQRNMWRNLYNRTAEEKYRSEADRFFYQILTFLLLLILCAFIIILIASAM